MARVNFTGLTDKVISGYKSTRLEVKGLLIVPIHCPLQHRNAVPAVLNTVGRIDVAVQTDRYVMRPVVIIIITIIYYN